MSKFEFYLTLDDPKRIFRNGDTVSGNLTVRSPEQIDVKYIIVGLYGYTRAKKKDFNYKGHIIRGRSNHSIVNFAVTVFPSERLRQANKSDSYTLPSGEHFFNFSFTIPSGDHVAECQTSFTHCAKLAKYEPFETRTAMSLPPTFYSNLDTSYGYVRYLVTAAIIAPGIFAKDVCTLKEITLSPYNDQLKYSMLGIFPYNEVTNFPNEFSETAMGSFYASIHSTRLQSMGFFKKLVSATNVAITIGLETSVKKTNDFMTRFGQLNRVILQETRLSEILKLNIMLPLSSFQIKAALQYPTTEDLFFRVTSIDIQLCRFLFLHADGKISGRQVLFPLFSGALPNDISVGAFKPPANDGSQYYSYNIDSSIFGDARIPIVPLPFLTCNIRVSYAIISTLTIQLVQPSAPSIVLSTTVSVIPIAGNVIPACGIPSDNMRVQIADNDWVPPKPRDYDI